MTVIVASQPSPFPWLGFFSKIQLCDVLIVLDDATYQKDGFLNRFRLELEEAPRFLTVPISRRSSHKRILECDVAATFSDAKILSQYRNWYRAAPHADAVEDLLADYLDQVRRSGLVEASVHSLSRALALLNVSAPSIVRSSELGVTTSGTQRLIDIVREVGGTSYAYGAGTAKRPNDYVDQPLLEQAGIEARRLEVVSPPGTRYSCLHELSTFWCDSRERLPVWGMADAQH
jgi:hypothetical protein